MAMPSALERHAVVARRPAGGCRSARFARR